MEPECVRRFVQISDLHVGAVDRQGKLHHPGWLRLLSRRYPALSGFSGHDFQALLDLVKGFKKLRKLAPAPDLLVTGDLTSFGGASQFALASDFICGMLPTPPFLPGIGLGTGPWLPLAMGAVPGGPAPAGKHHAIPGNHDHWPGRYYLLGNFGPLMKAWKPLLPYNRALPVPTKGGPPLCLRLLGMNSDADVPVWGRDRLLARGRFLTQIAALSAQLAAIPPDPNEARVLLVHHSLAYPGFTLGIDKASRVALEKLLVTFNIRVLLTGHTHAVNVGLHSLPRPALGTPFPVLEACCGTTSQLAVAPVGGPPPKAPGLRIAAHTFLHHELTYDGARLVWRTETWERSLMGGFARSPKNAMGTPYASQIQVWP